MEDGFNPEALQNMSGAPYEEEQEEVSILTRIRFPLKVFIGSIFLMKVSQILFSSVNIFSFFGVKPGLQF